MKKIKCSGPDCENRRRHWCEPDTPRGPQYVEVQDDYEGKAYCSLTCAMLDGAIESNGQYSYTKKSE